MSKKRTKSNRVIWYKVVAAALETKQTFSVENCPHKSRFIYQVIAYYLLDQKYGDDDTEKHKHFNYYCKKVQSGFKAALLYLESEEVSVYKHCPVSNHIDYVTLDKINEPNAQQDDFARLETRVEQTIKAAKVHVEIAHPRLVQRFNKSAQQLLLSGQDPE